MLKTQKWGPDTHPGTEFELQWDATDPDAPMVCLSAKVNGVPQQDPQGFYDRILTVNKRKNDAIHEAAQHAPPGLVEDILDDQGKPTGKKTFKADKKPDWVVDKQTGKVSLSIKGHPSDALNPARAALAARFGTDVEL